MINHLYNRPKIYITGIKQALPLKKQKRKLFLIKNNDLCCRRLAASLSQQTLVFLYDGTQRIYSIAYPFLPHVCDLISSVHTNVRRISRCNSAIFIEVHFIRCSLRPSARQMTSSWRYHASRRHWKLYGIP